MKRVCIVVGHARTGTYCEALGESYARGAASGGHQASLFVTSKMKFDPILHVGFERVQELEPDMKEAHDVLLAADHLVIIFPLWLGGMPAILKGFLERVLQGEMVEASKTHKFPKLLKGKSVRVIVTMGMPGFVYRWWFRPYALKILKRNILGSVGAGPIEVTIYGSIEAVSKRRRKRWLRDVEELGSRAA